LREENRESQNFRVPNVNWELLREKTGFCSLLPHLTTIQFSESINQKQQLTDPLGGGGGGWETNPITYKEFIKQK